MEATAMQPDANPKKLEASEPLEMPPGALELATAISVNRVEKGHQELTSQERSQRERMQRSISVPLLPSWIDLLSPRMQKRLAARKAEKRDQEEAPSMEEAMALLVEAQSGGADGADAVAPSPAASAPAESTPEAGSYIQVPECAFYRQTEHQGFVSGSVVLEHAERLYKRGCELFTEMHFSEAIKELHKAGMFTLRASLGFHSGVYARARAAKMFIQMAISAFNAQEPDMMIEAAELALNLDQKIADGWALRAKALLVKGEPLRARSSASRALELDPTNLVSALV